MTEAATNARIVFTGGALLVPAQNAYERQQLIDHVRGCVSSKQQVRVRVDHTTWLAEPADPRRSLVCNSCAQRVSRTLCRRAGTEAVYCVACALARPHLTVAFLSDLPAGTILRDVQAHYSYGGEWIAWTRWPQASPAEIIDDIHLQRRFAPVLTWRCAEICMPSPFRARFEIPHQRTSRAAPLRVKAG